MDLSALSRTIVLTAGLAALAGCGAFNGDSPWYREAGGQLNNGDFGPSVLQNIAAQTCNPNGRASAAGKLGPAPSDPVVVLDPTSTRANPVFRVHCSGRLDGKYAQVVYRDYVTSAGEDTTVNAATGE